MVNWCKVDDLSRKNDFPDLFEDLIQLVAIPLEKLEKTVLEEDLVTENKKCWKLVTKNVFQRSKSDGPTKIISFGGGGAQGKCFEVYNCTSKPFQNFPDLPVCLHGHCILLINHEVFCVGGTFVDDNTRSVVCDSNWKMDMNEKPLEWKEIASLNWKRFVMGGAVFHEVLVVAGGYDGFQRMSSVEFYLSALNKWTTSFPLCQPKSCCKLVVCDNYLYVLGGSTAAGECCSSVERTENLEEP